MHGLLDRCEATRSCPKIIQTVTDTEYWQRGMSLVTATQAGKRDLRSCNVRIYHMTAVNIPAACRAAAPAKHLPISLSNPNTYHYTCAR